MFPEAEPIEPRLSKDYRFESRGNSEGTKPIPCHSPHDSERQVPLYNRLKFDAQA